MKYALAILLFFIVHQKVCAQNEYKISNLSEQYDFPVYGITACEGNWYLTTTNKKAKPGKAFTDIFTTDSKLSKLTPFANEVMTSLDDGMPCFNANGDTMYFTSVQKDFLSQGKTDAKKLRIETAVKSGNGQWKKSGEFPYNNPQYRVAHPALSKDGNTLVFVSDMPGTAGGMDLYYCLKQDNAWSAPQNLTSLNTEGNELFPVLDAEGNLVFASDRPGGLGGLDLYMAKSNGQGYDVPVNLKAPLNSGYDDFHLFSQDGMKSGYISTNRFGDHMQDDILFFESLGKPVPNQLIVTVLDKYTKTPLPYVSVTVKDKSGEVFHKGLTDTKGQLILDELPKAAYTTQGMLNDISTTIAKIENGDFINPVIKKELLHNDPRFTLAGKALNTKTKEPLEGVTVSCTNTSVGTAKNLTTKDDGVFFFQLEQNSDFEVQGQKKGWLSSEVAQKTTKGLDRTTQLYVDIELKIEKPVNKGTITLKKIYYDYKKCDIRQDAAVELDRVVQLLNDYPAMTIELSSHTDSRGGNDYNYKLSQCRAESAVNYLIGKGIERKRLVAKGYGENKLLNNCKDGIECTEQQHEANRRTEFTILDCAGCEL